MMLKLYLIPVIFMEYFGFQVSKVLFFYEKRFVILFPEESDSRNKSL